MSVIKRYTGSAWELIGGGGSSNLVAETVVSGSAVTSVTFSGLDGNAAGGYVLCSELISAGGAAGELWLYVNGDETGTNYYSQVLYGAGTTVAAERTNSARIGAVDGTILSTTEICTVNSVYIANTQTSYGDASALMTQTMSTKKTGTVTNITSLKLSSQIANQLGIGSTFRLYKRK